MALLQKGDEDPQASQAESILLAPQRRVHVTLLDLILSKLPGVTVARNGLCLVTPKFWFICLCLHTLLLQLRSQQEGPSWAVCLLGVGCRHCSLAPRRA